MRSKTYLSRRGIPVRYVRLLRIGRFEIALTWIVPTGGEGR